MVDLYGRTVNYLRLSITDRCNLRCLYCVPSASWTFIPHKDVLRYEEMFRLVRAARTFGVRKVRLTGGEPLLRKGFVEFVADLHTNFPDMDLRITTNGTLLAAQAAALRAAGVTCLNISLDTLIPEKFQRITGVDAYARVRAGMDAALDAGVQVKVNVVALRGVNDGEIPDFVRLARTYDADVRFIEFMPVGAQSRWSPDNYWPAQDIVAEARRVAELIEDRPHLATSGPARMFRLGGGRGRIGVISAVSRHFCDTCNRFRITADGRLRTCLFSDRDYDLRGPLRSGADERALVELFERAGKEKPLGYQLLRAREKNQVCERTMSSIGG